MDLATRRLRLRDLDLADCDAMFAIEGDAESVRYQDYEPRTREQCRSYIERDIASRSPERWRFNLAVTLAGDSRFVGRVGLDVKAPERAVGELWFILDRALRGRGLMPEAATRMVELGFAEMGLRRIYMDCDPRNLAAVRVAEKVGMRREGQLRESVRIKGEWCDSLIFALLAREWAPAGP